jgi:drug/metabolite transporter (DMT)-like permease
LIPSKRQHPIARAIVLMAFSTVLFAMMAVVIRLASKTQHPFEIAFFRNLFGLMFTLPLLVRHGPGLFKTQKLPLYLLRCAIGTIGMMAGFWAIVNLPLAQAVALSYSTPIFVTIGAVLVLGEVVRARRWIAVLIGFVGVIILLHPSPDSFNAASLVALLAAVMSASVAISIKFLTRTERPDAIVLYTTLLWVPMSLVPALMVWQWPSGITWLWLVLAGLFGTVAHLCWTRALHLGEASMLTPISFLQVLIVGIFGWWLFDEAIDGYTVIGALIVFASSVFIAYRETRLAKPTITDPDVASETIQR